MPRFTGVPVQDDKDLLPKPRFGGGQVTPEIVQEPLAVPDDLTNGQVIQEPAATTFPGYEGAEPIAQLPRFQPTSRPIPEEAPRAGAVFDRDRDWISEQEAGLPGVAGAARSLTRGGVSGLLRAGEMAGQTLEWFAPEESTLEDVGRNVAGKIRSFRETRPGMFGESKASQVARKESVWNPRGWFYGGGESVGMMAPGLAIGGLPGAIATGGLFWGGTAQEAYDEINKLQPDLPESKKVLYANQKGLFEGGVETLQQLLPFAIAKAIPKKLKGKVIKKIVGNKGAVDLVKDYLKMIAGETGMEVFQEFAGGATDYRYDLRENLPTVKELSAVIGPTIIATGILGTSAHIGTAAERSGIQAALADPSAPERTRQEAVNKVHQAIIAEKADGSKELANAWLNSTAKPLQEGKAITIQDDDFYRENGIAPPKEVLFDSMLLAETEEEVQGILDQASPEDRTWILSQVQGDNLEEHLDTIEETGGPVEEIRDRIERTVGITAEAVPAAEAAQVFEEMTPSDLEMQLDRREGAVEVFTGPEFEAQQKIIKEEQDAETLREKEASAKITAETEAEAEQQYQEDLKATEEAILDIPEVDQKRMQTEARDEVESDPVYEHMAKARSEALDLKQIKQDYTKTSLKDIPGHQSMFTLNGRVSPDDFASRQGYESLDAMIEAFKAAPSKKKAIARAMAGKTQEWQQAEEAGIEAAPIKPRFAGTPVLAEPSAPVSAQPAPSPVEAAVAEGEPSVAEEVPEEKPLFAKAAEPKEIVDDYFNGLDKVSQEAVGSLYKMLKGRPGIEVATLLQAEITRKQEAIERRREVLETREEVPEVSDVIDATLDSMKRTPEILAEYRKGQRRIRLEKRRAGEEKLIHEDKINNFLQDHENANRLEISYDGPSGADQAMFTFQAGLMAGQTFSADISENGSVDKKNFDIKYLQKLELFRDEVLFYNDKLEVIPKMEKKLLLLYGKEKLVKEIDKELEARYGERYGEGKREPAEEIQPPAQRQRRPDYVGDRERPRDTARDEGDIRSIEEIEAAVAPKFAKARPITPKSTAADLTTAVDKLLTAKGRDNLNISIVQTTGDLKSGGIPIVGADGTTKGVFFKGEITLVANNISPERAWPIVLHESVHRVKAKKDWSGIFGKKSSGIMKSIDAKIKLNNPAWKAAEQKAIDAGTPSESIHEETITYFLADNSNQNQSLYRRIVNAIRAWAVNIGLRRKITDADIVALAESSIQREARKREDVPPTPARELAPAYAVSPLWHSRLRRLVNDFQVERQPADAWVLTFNSWKKKGKLPPALQEELEWSGLEEVLTMRGKEKITKGEILDLLAAGGVQVEETVLTKEEQGDFREEKIDAIRARQLFDDDLSVMAYDASGDIFEILDEKDFARAVSFEEWIPVSGTGEVKFETYQLPGGENYQEMLITLPTAVSERQQLAAIDRERPLTPAEQERYDELQRATKGEPFYKSPHFDQPNVLAHVRMNERTDAEGNKVLFIEEVQSDWHQEGRKKGYAGKPTYEIIDPKVKGGKYTGIVRLPSGREQDRFSSTSKSVVEKWAKTVTSVEVLEGVPEAPFKKTWSLLSMKRMISYAAENGFDKIAWTTGEQQAERYDLSKQVDEIRYTPNGDGTYSLAGIKDNASIFSKRAIPESKLEEFVGKDVAGKIINGDGKKETFTDGGETGGKILSGVDLKVGGEGMKGFYDKILPSTVGKFIKKYGGKVGGASLSEIGEVHAFDITPQMQEAAETEGMPLFAKGPKKDVSTTESAKKGEDIIDQIIAKMKERGLFKKEKIVPIIKKYENKISKLRDIAKDTATDITAKQKQVKDVLSTLPIHVRGRAINEIVKVGKFKTKEGRQRAVDRAMGRIVMLLDQYHVSEGIKQIDKLLKKAKVKVKHGISRGTTDVSTLEQLKKIKSIREMSFDQLGNRLDRIIKDDQVSEPTEDDISKMALLNTFGNLRNKTSEEIAEALEHLEYVIKEGKLKWNAMIEADRARRKEIGDMAEEVISAGKKPLEAHEKGLSKNIITESMKAFSDKSQSWQFLMEKLSRFEKGTKTLQSRMKYFVHLVHGAAHKETAGILRENKRIQAKLKEIYGKSMIRISWTLAKNAADIKNTGINLYGPGGGVVAKNIATSQNKAYKKWMEWQDPTLRDDLKRQGVTEQTITDIEKFMTPEVKAWAEWQLDEFYPDYYDSINEVFSALTYTNMPRSDKYSPTRRDYKKGSAEEMTLDGSASYHASMMKGANKRRVKNQLNLSWEKGDGDSILSQHIAEMEHFKAWALVVRELRSVFGRQDIGSAISDHHGDTMKGVVNDFIERFVRGGIESRNNIAALDRLRSMFTVFALAMNNVVFLKQLTSIPAYAMSIPVKDFMTGFATALANPLKASRVLMKSSMMQTRYELSRMERDLSLVARKTPAKQFTGKKNISDKAMVMTKLGDKMAIILGGYSAYLYHYKKQLKKHGDKKLANEEALREFEIITESAQQASGQKDLSVYQTGGSLQKGVTMFMTTPASYARYEEAALRNLLSGKGSKLENLKIIAITHILLPTIFQLVASGGEWDEQKMKRAWALGPLNGLFLWRDILGGVADQLFLGKSWGFSAQPHLDALYEILTNIADRGFALKDVTSLVAATRTFSGILDAISGQTAHPIRRSIGYSESALDVTKTGYNKYNKEFNRITKAYKEDRTNPRPDFRLKRLKSDISSARKEKNDVKKNLKEISDKSSGRAKRLVAKIRKYEDKEREYKEKFIARAKAVQ